MTGGWQGSTTDDYVTRQRARRIVEFTLLGAAAIVAIVGLVPLLFTDQEEARYAVTTILVGLVAIGFARVVVTRVQADMVAELGSLAVEFDKFEQKYATVEARYIPAREERPPEPRMRLTGVDLREATLPAASLDGVDLSGALLEGADLDAASLHRSRLMGADLRRACLQNADLRWADLRGADLRGASIEEAMLEGALYDEETAWPSLAHLPSELGAIHVDEITRERG